MAFRALQWAQRTVVWRAHRQKIIVLLLWLFLLSGYALYFRLRGLTIAQSMQQLLALFATPFGPLLYLTSFLLRPFFFFSAGMLCILGGVIFGLGSPANFLLALTYALIGLVLSALISFGMGRFFGQGILAQSQAQSVHWRQRYAERLRRNGFLTVLTMRLLLLPFDLVNYLAAFVAVDWKAFALATLIGVFPSTLAFVSFGAALDVSELAAGKPPLIDLRMILLALLLFLLSLVISRWYKGSYSNSISVEEHRSP